jgi:hypothetical protein
MSLSLAMTALVAAMGSPGPAGSGQYWSEARSDYESRRMAFMEHAASAGSGGL